MEIKFHDDRAKVGEPCGTCPFTSFDDLGSNKLWRMSQGICASCMYMFPEVFMVEGWSWYDSSATPSCPCYYFCEEVVLSTVAQCTAK